MRCSAPQALKKDLRGFFVGRARIRRGFGSEQVKTAVQAEKQREQAEKGRKQTRYTHELRGK